MSTAHGGGITAIATHTLYEIPPGAPVRWTPRATGQVRVCAGRIWLTREGDARDYWLEAGGAMPVAAGDVLWVSAEGDAPGRLEMRSPVAPLSVRGRAWRALRGAAGVRGVGDPATGGTSCDAAARVQA